MPTIKKRAHAAQSQPEEEIRSLAHKISDLTRAYQKQVAISVSVIIVALVAIATYSFLQNQKERRAAPMVAAAYELYNPAAGSPGDFPRALEAFRDIGKKYSGSLSASIARYYTGNCLMALGQNEEAVTEYWNLVNNYSGDKMLLGLAYQRMGYAYQRLGKIDDAKRSFELAEKSLGPGIATVELARIHESAGNLPEARTKYKTIAERLGGTGIANEAMSKIQLVTAEPAGVPAQKTK